MMNRILLTFAVFLQVLNLGAQSEVVPQLSTNFVSRIRVERENGLLKIFWKDAPDLLGETYEVYRLSEPISENNFDKAVLAGSIGENIEGFSDKPDSEGEYYYTVLARDAQGNLQKFFAPFRNVMMSSVQFTPSLPSASVLDVSARVISDRIVLSFRPTDATGNLMIFRTSAYPESREDLEKGILLATLPASSTSYQDIPPPGLPFFYSVVNAQTFTNAGEGLFSVSNRTADPMGLQLTQVQTRPRVVGPEPAASLATSETELIIPDIASIMAQARQPNTPNENSSTINLYDLGYREQVLRALPLPKLAVNEDINTGDFRENAYSPLPPSRPVNERVSLLFSEILKNSVQEDLPQAVILPEENTIAAGVGSRLASIVKENWNKRTWTSAIPQLSELLILDLEVKIRSRVFFYRAQAYAFTGAYERATFDFILAQSNYRAEATRFLDILLRRKNNL